MRSDYLHPAHIGGLAASHPSSGVVAAAIVVDPGPSLDDPVWWPDVERQFADYVTSTNRT